MKIYLCLLILIKTCSCLDDSEQSSSSWGEIIHDDGLRYDHGRHNPIYRPCAPHDVACIRGFFAHNSRCHPAHGPPSDTYRIKTLTMNIPHVNITLELNHLEIKGWKDYKIEEFYINKKTDTLVMEVVFEKLVSYAPTAVITYHRRGKEPIEVSDFGYIEYRDLSLTLTVNHINDIHRSRAHVYAYISDAAPKSQLGPNFTQNKDPQVQRANAELLGKIGLSLQEAFIHQGPVFMDVFLHNSICDFKIHNII